MKTIEVHDQVNIPLWRCVRLTLRGIRYRMFRSAITVAIVALAVAFLMMMLSTSTVDRAVAQDVHRKTQPRRDLTEWVGKLSVPMASAGLQARLLAARPGTRTWQELRQFGGLGDAQMEHLVQLAGRQGEYERYFDELAPGERPMLLGSREGEAAFLYLHDPAKAQEFHARLTRVTRPLPGGADSFNKFVADLAESVPVRKRILDGHAKAIQSLQEQLGRQTVLELLAAPAGREDMLTRSGFVADAAALSAIAGQARTVQDAERLVALLRDKRLRGVIAQKANVAVSLVNDAAVFEVGATSVGAQWLKDAVAKAGAGAAVPPPTLDLSVERIVEVCQAQRDAAELAAMEARLGADAAQASSGFSKRTMWLIGISFLVCAVGVANAMLMSVTERFREIATMKCLGALDSFIMIIFVMESCLQGLVGGALGVLLGLLLGVLKSMWGLGLLAVANMPGVTLSVIGAICLAAGVVLASVAAMYPAWVAARLAPMEAMRIE